MNMANMENAAKIGFIRCSSPKLLDRGFLVPKRLREGIGKLVRIERLLGERGNSLFDLNGVHADISNNAAAIGSGNESRSQPVAGDGLDDQCRICGIQKLHAETRLSRNAKTRFMIPVCAA